jgi:hypothetical protein
MTLKESFQMSQNQSPITMGSWITENFSIIHRKQVASIKKNKVIVLYAVLVKA